jgi:hypothetical protein
MGIIIKWTFIHTTQNSWVHGKKLNGNGGRINALRRDGGKNVFDKKNHSHSHIPAIRQIIILLLYLTTDHNISVSSEFSQRNFVCFLQYL